MIHLIVRKFIRKWYQMSEIDGSTFSNAAILKHFGMIYWNICIHIILFVRRHQIHQLFFFSSIIVVINHNHNHNKCNSLLNRLKIMLKFMMKSMNFHRSVRNELKKELWGFRVMERKKNAFRIVRLLQEFQGICE